MNIFQELRNEIMQTSQNTHKDRAVLNSLVEFFRNDEYANSFSQFRKISIEGLIESKTFMCDEDFDFHSMPVEFKDERLGFVTYRNGHLIPLFAGKYVFPIQDNRHNVAGLVGYNATYEKDGGSKYFDSKNIGYRAKHTTFYGMENLPEYYESNHIFVTEGVICTHVLRDTKLNAVSVLGSMLSPYVSEIFKRFENRCIFIVDSDEAGFKFATQIKRVCPLSRIIHFINGKDVDEARFHSTQVLEELTDYAKNRYKHYKTFRII